MYSLFNIDHIFSSNENSMVGQNFMSVQHSMSGHKRLHIDEASSISSNVNDSDYEPSSKRLRSKHEESYQFDFTTDDVPKDLTFQHDNHDLVLTPMKSQEHLSSVSRISENTAPQFFSLQPKIEQVEQAVDL